MSTEISFLVYGPTKLNLTISVALMFAFSAAVLSTNRLEMSGVVTNVSSDGNSGCVLVEGVVTTIEVVSAPSNTSRGSVDGSAGNTSIGVAADVSSDGNSGCVVVPTSTPSNASMVSTGGSSGEVFAGVSVGIASSRSARNFSFCVLNIAPRKRSCSGTPDVVDVEMASLRVRR